MGYDKKAFEGLKCLQHFDAMKKYFGEPEENIEFYYYQYK